MTGQEAGKLPQHLQNKEIALEQSLSNLRLAYTEAIRAEEQLKVTLQRAEKVLDENNY